MGKGVNSVTRSYNFVFYVLTSYETFQSVSIFPSSIRIYFSAVVSFEYYTQLYDEGGSVVWMIWLGSQG